MLMCVTVLVPCLTTNLFAGDIIAKGKSFKWTVVISEPQTSTTTKTLVYDKVMDRTRLPVDLGECYLSLLDVLKTDEKAKWEQSANLTCNSVTVINLCRLGDKGSSWINAVVEKKDKFVGVSVYCDQFDGSSFHDSASDHFSEIFRSLWPFSKESKRFSESK
jgi:hypothetical protein